MPPPYAQCEVIASRAGTRARTRAGNDDSRLSSDDTTRSSNLAEEREGTVSASRCAPTRHAARDSRQGFVRDATVVFVEGQEGDERAATTISSAAPARLSLSLCLCLSISLLRLSVSPPVFLRAYTLRSCHAGAHVDRVSRELYAELASIG